MLKLSQKYKEFLQTKCKREFLEGTTAAGKTTVGIFKFMCMVADSDKKYHIIAGDDVGTVEKNVINSENGLLEQFEDIAEYWPKGKDKIRLPHIRYDTNKGEKIIYVCGYGDKKRWKKVLGGQVGCVYLDEVNLADMGFMREVTHRCKYMMTTSNPDDPSLDIYKEFINKSRPIPKYEKDYPTELLKELKEPHVKGWVHWYFTFYDNAALTKEDKEEFARFGESLGYLDVEMQKNAMKLYLKELEQKIEYLQKEIPQKRKLYQSLGVMGGIFLLILLWQ